MSPIACLGVLVADVVGAPIDALPRRGTLELVERIELHIGGNAANTAAALAKLGPSARLVGRRARTTSAISSSAPWSASGSIAAPSRAPRTVRRRRCRW